LWQYGSFFPPGSYFNETEGLPLVVPVCELVKDLREVLGWGRYPHGAGIDELSKDVVEEVDDHVQEFIPSNLILAL